MANLNQYQTSVLMATSLSYVIVILDTSIVNVALPSIATELGAGLSGLQWVVNAYTLAFAGLLVLVENPPYWRIALCLPLLGLVAGVITPAATSVLMNEVTNERAGIAAGVLNVARQSGSAFGVAIFGALMSMLLPQACGIYIAVCSAIGLSLIAAAGWFFALKLSAKPMTAAGNGQGD